MISECNRHRWAKVEEVNFKTAGLKGMSYLAADGSENNKIILLCYGVLCRAMK
jgi:hypothetical protein